MDTISLGRDSNKLDFGTSSEMARALVSDDTTKHFFLTSSPVLFGSKVLSDMAFSSAKDTSLFFDKERIIA